ncbi:MAG: hypothetical protein QNJ98_02505 [Planctomycetota bacterium]|nr:hypothetical protein [Planctomycetota bacterium]
MQSPLTVISLAVAIIAVGVAGYAVMENRSLRAELESNNLLGPEADGGGGPLIAIADADLLERLEAVEEDVARVEKVATTHVIPGMPSLAGREVDTDSGAPAPMDPLASPDAETKVKDLVDEAVEKKAQQFRQMQNKKPSIDVFADVLELDEEQRALAEREIVRGQRELRSLLETPADDGTVFLDEIVETMAAGMANPGEAGARWTKLLGRLMTENVPGTDTTYAASAEAIKVTVRDAFKSGWSESQYERFESWQMDPTEVQGVEGSAWSDLENRVLERARDLGADIPEDAGK